MMTDVRGAMRITGHSTTRPAQSSSFYTPIDSGDAAHC